MAYRTLHRADSRKSKLQTQRLEKERFAPDVETTAYRVVQEALTNVARHANVNEATVRVWTHLDTLSIEVADEGQGFDLDAVIARETSGLTGMRERATLAGGQLKLESRAGGGTRLFVELRTRTLPQKSGS